MEQYLIFSIDNNLHGITLLEAGQLYKAKNTTPIPMSNKYIRGMVNIENKIRTVIDLGQYLYGKQINIEDRIEKRFISLINSDICLLVDNVHEITELGNIQKLQINDKDALIARHEDKVISIINVKEILEKTAV